MEEYRGGIQTLETHSNLGTLQDYRIRKLTPREYWRLMAFTDDDFDKAQAIQSNSQLYKEAGNSIVVSVLEGIFTNLIELDNNLNRNG
ncbi:DNA cytosine methyltransferase [Bacteroides coprosuis]|uniref:DNA cytosine methyltransferase n=1 Tax=Bacteroides coprosuis TaxID=151276 RepID=UPI001DF4B3D5|nr:DNA cytosine methyltransferase [Bacteroides coprosuis]HJD91299.1 DNA cytosine methyltransferase [Bacteroides coprosuis]